MWKSVEPTTYSVSRATNCGHPNTNSHNVRHVGSIIVNQLNSASTACTVHRRNLTQSVCSQQKGVYGKSPPPTIPRRRQVTFELHAMTDDFIACWKKFWAYTVSQKNRDPIKTDCKVGFRFTKLGEFFTKKIVSQFDVKAEIFKKTRCTVAEICPFRHKHPQTRNYRDEKLPTYWIRVFYISARQCPSASS